MLICYQSYVLADRLCILSLDQTIYRTVITMDTTIFAGLKYIYMEEVLSLNTTFLIRKNGHICTDHHQEV